MPNESETAGQSSQEPESSESNDSRQKAQIVAGEDAPRRSAPGVISLGRVMIGGLACLPLLLFALSFGSFLGSQRVLAKVVLAGLDVGGSTKAELEQRLEQRARLLAKERLRLRLGAKEAALTVEELGAQLAVAGSAARALRVARSPSLWSNAWTYLRSVAGTTPVPAELRVDEARLSAALTELEPKLIDDPPFGGGLSVENGVVRALPARPGRRLALAAARAAIADAVALGRTPGKVELTADVVSPKLDGGSLELARARAQRMLAQRVTLEAGERRLEIEPAELGGMLSCAVVDGVATLSVDAARLETWLEPRRASLEAPARDATFAVSAQDQVTVSPSAPGVRLATAAVAQALWTAAASDEHRGPLPISAEPLPTRTTEQAEALGIRKLVGSFTTRHPCCQPRVDNIHRVAALLDGLVVEPGKEQSVNAIVGPRTQKNGFVLAPSIEDGEMVDTVGGGVSQFATTLFNALFRAGYDIIERKPHSYWFPRYPMGIEATLSWPHPDIVFRNDSAAGLLVKTSFTDTTITVKLYGDVGNRRVATRVSERREIVAPALELLPNRAVPPDEEKVKEGGMIGWSVLVERTVTFADGSKREDKRKVTYKPKPRRVEVHPCRIPKGEPGASGEPCPEPEPEPEEPATAAEPLAAPAQSE